jgi:predicted nucleotidyltransferase component of viral defense system
VEKDYIISIVLEEITKIDDSIIFKGGTSLSKMRGLLNRFSEDIDLSYCEKLTDGVHRKRNKNLFEKLKESLKKYPQFNFSIDKSENSLTGHVLFKFEIKYSSCIGDEQQNKVIIEIY